MMSHRWIHEDEYLQLSLAMNRARRAGHTALYAQLQARQHHFDVMLWQSMVTGFPELTPYQSVREALQETAVQLNIPFPDLTHPSLRTGDGHFSFGLADGRRTVQIWPLQSRGVYTVELFTYEHGSDGVCYQGATSLLHEVTWIVSSWFVDRVAIPTLHHDHPWIHDHAVVPVYPHLSFE